MNIRSRKTTLERILLNVNLKLSNYYGLRLPCQEVIKGIVWSYGSSTETTRRSSSQAKNSYVSEYQAMRIQLMKVKSDIAMAGNNFPLKKMLKRWPYILIRPENGGKKWVVHIKSIWLTYEHNVLMYINNCLSYPNNIPRMVAWLYMVMSPCDIHHLSNLDCNKISVRPNTKLYKAKW